MVSIIRRLLLSVSLVSGSLAQAADKGPDFSGQDLVGKNFTKQLLENANFEDAVLKYANFDGATVTKGNFQGADLSHAIFSNADLTSSDFRGAQLAFTMLYMCNLNGANLEKADLSQNGGLSHVKLRKANLRKLKGIGSIIDVDFSEADLRGANLVAMKSVGEKSRFRKAKYDVKTRWPKDFDVEASGAILVDEPEKDDADDDKPAPGKDKPEADATTKALEKEFAALDANDDGRLSGKEMQGLEKFDTNKDGRVTREEFMAGKKK